MKKTLAVICFSLITTVSIGSEVISDNRFFKELSPHEEEFKDEYNYVWELRYTDWWVCIYDEDGKLVTEYPME